MEGPPLEYSEVSKTRQKADQAAKIPGHIHEWRKQPPDLDLPRMLVNSGGKCILRPLTSQFELVHQEL